MDHFHVCIVYDFAPMPMLYILSFMYFYIFMYLSIIVTHYAYKYNAPSVPEAKRQIYKIIKLDFFLDYILK